MSLKAMAPKHIQFRHLLPSIRLWYFLKDPWKLYLGMGAGERTGGQPSIQCRAWFSVDDQWNCGDGGMYNGWGHDELRCRFGSFHSAPSHKSCTPDHGEDTTYLPCIWRSRRIREAAGLGASPPYLLTYINKLGSVSREQSLVWHSTKLFGWMLWQGVETKEPGYFITKENQERLARARGKNMVQVLWGFIHLGWNVLS